MTTARPALKATPPGAAPRPSGKGTPRPRRPGLAMGRHAEHHRSASIGWLRAAVLGANDGIVSTACLVLGMAAAGASPRVVLMTGVSGLIAGAMSMAAGEFVSVHAQADTEAADLARERAELQQDPAGEQRELAGIYRSRGLDAALADQVAQQLMTRDALAAHAREELGQSDSVAARPLQAALASAASFAVGAALPIAVVALGSVSAVGSPTARMVAVTLWSLAGLAALGALSARVGGAPLARSVGRVLFWGAFAMAVTAGAGRLFGAVV